MSSSLHRVGIAASLDFLDLDESWPVLRDALQREGFSPEVAAWDDDQVDWQDLEAVLVNYAWGYVADRSSFLAWAETVSAAALLLNPFRAIRWNSSKTYLVDLSAEVEIVPTTVITPGGAWSPPANDYVIKPAVSSGGIGAARYRGSDRATAERHIERLHGAGQDVIVQPYQAEVDRCGETALVFLAGEFSHAVCKQALLEPDVGEVDRLWEREVIDPVVPRADQLDLAERALRAATSRVGDLAYVRIDLVDGERGPRVLEVELIEPSLFLPDDGVAASKLAAHVRSLLHR